MAALQSQRPMSNVPPSRPIILQIIPALDAGGAERTVIEVAEAIVLAGGMALVASEGGRLEGELGDAGGELIRFPASAKNPLTVLANAAQADKTDRRARRQPRSCAQPGPCLERAFGGKMQRRSLRDHLSRRLQSKERAERLVQRRHGAGRHRHRQFVLHGGRCSGAPPHTAGSASHHLSRRRSRAIFSGLW